MSPFVSFLLYILAVLAFVGASLGLNKLLGPKPARTAVKQEPFECGATPAEAVNVKPISVKYYAIAVVFVLFDLETIFLYLWALGAQPLTGFMLLTLGLFLALLVLILVYVWRSGILTEVTE